MEDWIGNSKDSKETSKPSFAFSDDEIGKYMKEQEVGQNFICMGIIGDDGTGKSGLAMDYRTQKDIEEGKQLIIFDLDAGCAPIKHKYHKSDPNIKIYNPIEYLSDTTGIRVDYQKTMEKIKSMCSYMIRNKDRFPKVKAVILDGVDQLLKIAEYQMKIEKHITPDGRADYQYWTKRNIDYQQVMNLIKRLPWDKFYITHDKELDEEQERLRDAIFSTKKTRVKLKPAWEKKTSDMMYQIIETYREDSADKVEFKYHIRKWKGKAEIEGKDFTFCTVDKTSGKVDWKGLTEVLK